MLNHNQTIPDEPPESVTGAVSLELFYFGSRNIDTLEIAR
jgi:hypothetical protein